MLICCIYNRNAIIMSETDEIIGSAEPMESEMLSDNLQLIVGNREYIYSHRELFLSPAPVSVYGINGPIAVGTLLKLWEQGITDGYVSSVTSAGKMPAYIHLQEIR